MASMDFNYKRSGHPVDLLENIATMHDWAFERSAEDALHLACAVDLKVSDVRLSEVYRLMATINEQLWIGHFDLWRTENLLLYRHGLMLNAAEPTVPQCEALLHSALDACERYFQAFQFVIWAGKSAEESLASIMFETEGQA
jgi:hypothetical protein